MIPVRILVADDSPDNIFIIRAYLKHTGYVIETAGNGEDAILRVQSEPFDLVLMDVQMPLMDGYTATAAIRQWENETGRRPIPILAVTANTFATGQASSIAAGCTGHLTKPIGKANLLKAIADCLSPNTPIRVSPPGELLQFVPEYLENVRSGIGQIRAAAAESGFEQISFIGHQMKGTGSSFGFEEVTNLGAAIEDAASQSDKATVEATTRQLECYLERIEIVP